MDRTSVVHRPDVLAIHKGNGTGYLVAMVNRRADPLEHAAARFRSLKTHLEQCPGVSAETTTTGCYNPGKMH